MAQIAMDGKPVNTAGDLPSVGTQAPDFALVKPDLTEITLKDLAGKKVILSIFPSIDTPLCAASVRAFNKAADKLDNVAILCVSMDLPFAHRKFRGAEDIESVISVSDFRHRTFGNHYGVSIVDGALATLFSRAVVILDESGKVIYTEQVPDISEEPDYDAAFNALK